MLSFLLLHKYTSIHHVITMMALVSPLPSLRKGHRLTMSCSCNVDHAFERLMLTGYVEKGEQIQELVRQVNVRLRRVTNVLHTS